MTNPADIFALEVSEAKCQIRIAPEAASAEDVQEAIDFNYQSDAKIKEQITSISLPGESETTIEEITADSVADAPIAKALTVILDGAIKALASDIHIQPEENELRVRYHIDGTLQETLTLPLSAAVSLISRIRILAKMNIADHQRPRDSQLSVKPIDRQEIDIRVGTIPIVHGEMAALRLLDKSKALMTMPQLGFFRKVWQSIKR
jgi:type II secretory ATPase GspE/PulE/Tfp pilus assembly ATPase PilB-like protein